MFMISLIINYYHFYSKLFSFGNIHYFEVSMTKHMSFAYALAWFILVKDILHGFLSFSTIYFLVYNFLS